MDKQIIDEERMFECVWCKYGFKESDANFILSENPNECVCSGCITEWADNLLCDLKRKEQECEELKKIINEAKNSKLDLNSFFAIEATVGEYQLELDQLKAENKHLNDLLNQALKDYDKAIQTLTEIKEIAEDFYKTGFVRTDCGATLINNNTCIKTLEQILQKISEVEDEN